MCGARATMGVPVCTRKCNDACMVHVVMQFGRLYLLVFIMVRLRCLRGVRVRECTLRCHCHASCMRLHAPLACHVT